MVPICAQAQFYTGSLVLGLEVLAARPLSTGIWNLKMSLDHLGYCKLADFGIAKNLGAHRHLTCTAVGRPLLHGTGGSQGGGASCWA